MLDLNDFKLLMRTCIHKILDKMKITTENKHMLRYPALSSMSIFDISFNTAVTYSGR